MWYKTGTISVSNNSKTVTGIGTGWVANVRTGDGLQGPDGKLYEVTNVASDTSISIEPAYAGATIANRAYWLIPVQGYVRKLADKAAQLLQSYNDVLQHTGTRTDALMSQKAVTDELNLRLLKSSIDQAAGDSITKVMSQKAVSDLLAIKSDTSYVDTELGKKAVKTEVASQLTIIYRDAFRDSVEKASGGKNTVIYDAQGKPNVMVVIPRFNYEDLVLDLGTGTVTAFETKGVPRSEIIVGKYLLSDAGTVGGQLPKTGRSYDQFKAEIVAKGTGWHMLSQHEWAAIGLWSIANGTIPRGNTNYGRAHDAKWETGVAANKKAPGDSAGANHTLTGSGPATWNHDHTDFGVSDLVGNVWEWVDQYKIVEGQIFCTLDNDPSAPEASWVATGIFMDLVGGVLKYSDTLSTVTSSQTYFKDVFQGNHELLQRLLAEPTASSVSAGGRVYWNSAGERLPVRGGNWSNGAVAGLATLNLSHERSLSRSDIGCRPAYFGS